MGERKCRFEKNLAYRDWAAASKDDAGSACSMRILTEHAKVTFLRVREVFQNELTKE